MLKKLFFLAVLPILVELTGCTGCERLEETYYRVGRGGGVMNDSMALLSRCVTNYYFTDGLGGGERYEDIGCHLLLVDIRYEKIYWEKEISNNMDGMFEYLGAVLDSVLFFLREDHYNDTCHYISKIAFQMLGDDNFQVNYRPKKINLIGGKGWKYASELRIRPWKEGLTLANDRGWDGIRSGNHYALLDAVAGTMELWQPSGEFEWLNECVDAKWSSIGGLCLKEIPDTLGFVLLKNGVDTLAVRYMPYKLPVSENMESPLVFTGNSIFSKGWVYLINKQWQVSEKPLDVWVWTINGFYFQDLHGNLINYNKKIVY